MDIKALIEEATQALNDHDLEKFASLHDPNVEFTDPGRSGKGREDFVALLKLMHAAFPDMRSKLENLMAEGDKAFFEATLEGTQSAPFRMPDGPEIPATGKRVSLRAAVYVEGRDGKIVKSHAYQDRMEMMEQLGVMSQASTTARGCERGATG
ncbi:MAG: nuclear transport factor 2 family protein [Chloroflexi bacterium]|nr:MAG: nuclear transport factor 2 family protein [Chloroflexota bacterium]